MNAADFAARRTITERDLEPYLDVINPGRNIKPLASFAEDVADLMGGKDPGGDKLPWPKTHSDFRFLPGEVTLWPGINGHGKSAVTTQVAVHLGLQGRKSCLASFEMAPERTVQRMLLQAAGNPHPTEEFFAQFFVKFTPLISIYDKRGREDTKFLFAAMRYCAAELGTTHFFVDSMMKCVRGTDDYNGQKNFIEDCCDVAKETGLHIHVVHHVRKSDSENKIPDKFDARGAGEITDLVHNVLTVWRNKRKEEAKRTGEVAKTDEDEPDFLLICQKQRTLGWEGRWSLWGDLQTWHFRETAKTPWIRGYELRAA